MIHLPSALLGATLWTLALILTVWIPDTARAGKPEWVARLIRKGMRRG